MGEGSSLERFAVEVARGESADLARAALLVGAMAEPDLDVPAYQARLEDLAKAAAARGLPPLETLRSLFQEEGFRGNQEDYYDPRNSFLHQVLDRRLGIPITLCVLAIEVGGRLAIEVEGVPFPGHFLVRVRSARGAVLIDPFAAGVEVGDADLLERARAVTGRIGSLGPGELGRASKQQILARMLQNLKAIYVRGEDWERAHGVQERMLALRPHVPEELRDRGLLRARLEQVDAAESDLLGYLEQAPQAADAEAVRQVALYLRKKRGTHH